MTVESQVRIARDQKTKVGCGSVSRLEDGLSAVAMVHIEVNHRHPPHLRGALLQRVERADRDVVEEAEAARDSVRLEAVPTCGASRTRGTISQCMVVATKRSRPHRNAEVS